MNNWLIHNFSVRSIVVLTLVFGSVGLAIADSEYRPFLADLCQVGLGGYLGQLVPKK
ncbi:MAG: hypothetical protein AAGF26_02675 [Cyanobacteria bacterium P01_G01_bin.49]